MGRQLFGDGPFTDAPVGLATALSSTSAEALWVAATWTPIYGNDAKAGKIYCVRAGGTGSLTGGTGIITPTFTTGSVALGASLTQGTATILACGFYLMFDLLIQAVTGAAASVTSMTGAGMMAFGGGVVSGTANPNTFSFGGTAATAVDTSINGAIQIQKTLSTTNSVTPRIVYIFARN
jgi:hypothetical protein